ncbi:methyltransferase domain-containing protein [Candidatus Woesearchaeota archaeon]|jgi:tRNA (adenine57-N1/adenine58-N1)-methyltransferase catalytic subunit|nr:methyltransferase domain-containing protein [Candidatus Woesearchaeota archaeon]MBT4110610.1 methyltransferase domain-containing protein [Candidatus Woesearchaeota archaeon]MBT4335866.1 methyltransferase domain-containing protein [Candidatus Woesearchaeota archaeon]MBT4469155.1 methyltransferase domain-containing protein [Candidatus Woesearchaeota archaeon]MBT6744526.1 methyltransferase domain-containing protein [Candidatus Woesearchaeota archaeon]
MRNIKKILIEQKTGKKHFVKDLDDNYHTSSGVILKKDLKSKKNIIKSDKGKTFFMIEPTFPDLWESLSRGPQLMLPKDIGMVMAKTGINHNSKIVDAGGGTGSLCLSLANMCKEITVYEINPEHYDVVAKNIKLFGFKNIKLKHDSIYKGIKEKDLDLITLDLPEPWQVIEHAEKSLKQGAHLVVYLPNLNQVKMFIDSCRRSNIKVTETLELIERKWKIEDRIMRPEFQMLGHTGFLIFCRKF